MSLSNTRPTLPFSPSLTRCTSITGLSLLYLLISSPHFLIRTQRNIMKIYLFKVFGMMVAIPSGTSARGYSSLRGYVSMLIIYNLHYSLKNLFELVLT